MSYFISLLGIDEIKDYKRLTEQLVAEFIGTFLYLSLALQAGTTLYTNVVAVALANGLLVASIVQIIRHISGGHINPAVTLGFLMCGNMKILTTLCYVAVQILAALLGSLVAYALTVPSSRGTLGATESYDQLDPGQVLVLELLMTFVMVSVALSAVDYTLDARGLGSTPLAIGLSITGCQCACLPYSGSLNPVRSLGPAVIMSAWTNHWVYWAGPLLGGLLAGLVKKFVFSVKVQSNV